ncbi:hypothetical protein XELAEV_18030125mg [Xenopus laevis]|uniref:GIY-YIG domain-containing protein n=1 Tax=Xenopus laevis TaxID=8355 RepID=A0A974CSS1_XENLA|nr:hypothetical protein XELAEV_18030125mg [Xenopus laevis]
MVYFSRARTIKNLLAPSRIWGYTRHEAPQHHFGLKDIFKCQKSRCGACSFVMPKKYISDELPRIDIFSNCSSIYVVYLILCPCKKITKRTVGRRISEHIRNIRIAKMNHSVSRHYKESHSSDPKGTLFLVLEQIPASFKGGDRLIRLRQRETFWIFELNSLQPHGLNIDLAAF